MSQYGAKPARHDRAAPESLGAIRAVLIANGCRARVQTEFSEKIFGNGESRAADARRHSRRR
jgi:hypothetical protein